MLKINKVNNNKKVFDKSGVSMLIFNWFIVCKFFVRYVIMIGEISCRLYYIIVIGIKDFWVVFCSLF